MNTISKNSQKANHTMWQSAFPGFYKHMNKDGKFVLKENHPIKGTLHDSFSPKYLDNIDEIIAFLEQDEVNNNFVKQKNNLAPEAYKAQMIANISLAFKLAKRYLESKWYFLSQAILNTELKTEKEIVNFYKKQYKASQGNTNEKMYFCTLLKCILSFMSIIQYDKFKVDYQEEKIDLKNEDFTKEIINIFNDETYFKYEKESDVRFSENSTSMRGAVQADWKRFPINATFDVKSLWSVIEKMNGQEKYHSVDAFKDLHRMRIEVDTPDEALHVARILYKKLGSNLSIENVWEFVPQDIKHNFINTKIQDDFDDRRKFGEALKNMKVPKAKNSSSDDRKEFKLTRSSKGGQMGIEIQIVPRENRNEIGFSHHDIYRIKRQINEKIRLQWYIRQLGIQAIINRIFAENEEKNNGKLTINLSKDQVYNHVMEKLKLIEIISEKANANKSTKSYSNFETLEKYARNYEENAKNIKLIIDKNRKIYTSILGLTSHEK